MAETNYSYIAIGVGLIAIAFGGYYTFFMGCTNSVGVDKSAPAPVRAKKDKEPSEKPKYPNGSISIFFGSQTGTAEGFARTLMLEGRKAGFDCKTCDLEEFDPEVLASTKLAIFLMATYGEGEPTDNAQKFMAWLKNENGEITGDFLANMKYVVFGLGNRQYEHFNRTGKQCDAGLKEFGGQPVYKYGEGDDDGTLEEDFDAWKENLWSGITGGSIRAGANDAEDAMETVSLTFDINTVNTNSAQSDTNRGAAGIAARDAPASMLSSASAASSKMPASLKHFYSSPRATVTTNRELRNLSFGKSDKEGIGSTRHIEINLRDVGLTYFTADNLAVLPENESSVVEKLAKYMNYHLDDVVEFTGREAGFVAPYPTPCTVRELLTSYADIQGPVRHSLLKQLIAYVTDTDQKHWALYLVAPEQRAKFKEQIEEGHHSLVSLVTGPLSSARIPLADLLHMVNPIQPRYYTISSSSSYHPDTVHITVSVTETVTKTGHKHIGLCSGFLQRLVSNQSTVRVFVRASTFRLPKSFASPVVLVGPGTGLAPMRALLQERHFLLDQNKNSNISTNNKIGDFVLFFGCKYENMDFIYREEIERFQSEGTLTNLYTAFSRDGDRKVYVQHLMTEDAVRGKKLVQMLVEEGGSLYVCGATAMGLDVMNAIVTLVKTHQNLSTEDATAIVRKLQEKGRYVQELWTA
jgi:NADPH-ferrihemoprotein reductase